MSEVTLPITTRADSRPQLDSGFNPITVVVFIGAVAIGLGFTAFSIYSDMADTTAPAVAWAPFILLGVALLIALCFEFVNGFHDTANAVATVIYTHSLRPGFAVVWSGCFNFLGVLLSSGAVAFGIISLLPVELILQVGSGAGFAMVFALLIAAIIWNLGTWYLGLPASSSHTLIGSVIGVGIANQLMAVAGSATSGVDWGQATKIGWSLLLSPLIGFSVSALLLMALKALVKNPALYSAPKGNHPPPWWIRSVLILTCTGVSFAHGSNDGQKGMGLIMLILIGTLPTAYALNRALPDSEIGTFKAVFEQTAQTFDRYATVPAPTDERATIDEYLKTHHYTPEVIPALAALSRDIAQQIDRSGSSMKHMPAEATKNVRNDMYLASETTRLLTKESSVAFDKAAIDSIATYRSKLDQATKFIPLWVKVAVAIALGLGTMVGWKRIVVTVGERIGKTHLTYAQGASAELVAAGTIAAADMFGLPVSTTHVLSSGVAGTMAANKSGLQTSTIRNLLMAWLLTLPAAILLSGSLYWLFTRFV